MNNETINYLLEKLNDVINEIDMNNPDIAKEIVYTIEDTLRDHKVQMDNIITNYSNEYLPKKVSVYEIDPKQDALDSFNQEPRPQDDDRS